MGTALRVMLADDTLFFRTALSGILEESGWEVLQAADGREALECAQRELPGLDLVILDVEMPEKSGIEVLREIRQTDDGATVAAVILSGNQFSSEEQQVLEGLGVRMILEKSVPLPELASQLIELVAASRRKIR